MSKLLVTSLDEIKSHVLAGRTVNYQTNLYIVEHDSIGQWLIRCTANNNCIGLTWQDGVTLNGDPWHFYVESTG